MIDTLSRWATLLAKDPVEFFERLQIVADIKIEGYFGHRPEYDVVTWDQALKYLSAHLGEVSDEILAESALAELEASIQESIRDFDHSSMPTPIIFNADRTLAKLCYLLCRLIQPGTVVETGVGYGVSSAHFLKAMEVNGSGRLISVDLPPLREGAEEMAGYLVPDDLRGRWDLRRGSVTRVFKELMPTLDEIGIFLHDSARTKSLIDFEFDSVYPKMSKGAAILANSIQWNSSFKDLVEKTTPDLHLHIKQLDKEGVTGVCVF